MSLVRVSESVDTVEIMAIRLDKPDKWVV